MRLLILALLLLHASPATPKKLPLEMNFPQDATRFWSVQLKLVRGHLRFGRVVRRFARRGRTIYRMDGPYRLDLMGAGKKLDTYRFSFPLLGPGTFDELLARGMTAETTVLVPDSKDLRNLVARGPGVTPTRHRLGYHSRRPRRPRRRKRRRRRRKRRR